MPRSRPDPTEMFAQEIFAEAKVLARRDGVKVQRYRLLVRELRRRSGKASVDELLEELELDQRAGGVCAHECVEIDCTTGPTAGTRRCSDHAGKLASHFQACLRQLSQEHGWLYVGRTHWPEKRLLEHREDRERGFDRLAVLHWTSDRSDVAELEGMLIEELKGIGTLRNRVHQRDPWKGGTSGAWHCVYAAWTAGATAARPQVDVTRLGNGPRHFPRSLIGHAPLIYGTNLDAPSAGAQVQRWVASRRR